MSQSGGRPLKPQAGSLGDSMNDLLRAPRRSGKSFDYLAGQKDQQRTVPPKKFDYHDAASPNARGKSFDYLHADQNRESAVAEGEENYYKSKKNNNNKNKNKIKKGSDASGSSVSDALHSSAASDGRRFPTTLSASPKGQKEAEKSPQNPLFFSNHRADSPKAAGDEKEAGDKNKNKNDEEEDENENEEDGFDSDSDSEAGDAVWLSAQLAERLPAIFNPPGEPLVAAKTANAGPIGLLGFGMTTILLNLVNTGHYQLFTVVPAMGICYGGGAQFIAGVLEWCRGNTFGYVAFVSYGAFWCSLVCIWMLPNEAIGGPAIVKPTSSYFLGTYLIIWGIFSFMMMCCTIRMNVAIFLVFLSVTLLFFLLGGANMAGNESAVHAAGYEGIVCGSLALYLAFAEILNEVWDRTILPVIPMPQLIAFFRRVGKKKEPSEEKTLV